MAHAFDDAYSKNWEAQRCAPEGTKEQGTFFATRAGLEAALSAQPSPGGQDALATARELLAAEYDKAGEKVFADRARKGRYDNDPDVRAIVAALAARQPVGAVPSIDYEDLLDQAKDLIHCGCSVNGAFEWLLEQLTDGEALAAPPAQAVDLGQFREAVQEAYDNADGGTPTMLSLGELLDLIDSRDSRNG
jgi:hypothetical protein